MRRLAQTLTLFGVSSRVPLLYSIEGSAISTPGSNSQERSARTEEARGQHKNVSGMPMER